MLQYSVFLDLYFSRTNVANTKSFWIHWSIKRIIKKDIFEINKVRFLDYNYLLVYK